METGLKGNLLPDNGGGFADNILKMKNMRCVNCGGVFTNDNTFTRLGWRETQISGFCEVCFDEMFRDE